MARETKVGLLAGLAFIVCFAIILANRGKRDSFVRSVDHSTARLADARRSPRPIPSTANARIQHARRPAVGGDIPTASDASATSHDPETAPGDSGSAVPLPPDNAREGTQRLAEAGNSPTQRPGAGIAQSNAEPAPVPANTESARIAATDGSLHDTRQHEALTALLSDLSNANRQADPATPSSAQRQLPTTESSPARIRATRPNATPVLPNATRRQASTARRHKVASGDTLSKIANRFYGSRSRRTIDAIVDANRSALSDPDMLRIGVELRLPELGDAPGKDRGAAASVGKAKPDMNAIKTDGATNGRDIRWYQIRKNDRYVTIAREQLGDESRWPEIYELNRDKFPDAGRIREGVRIKLPR